LAGSPRQPEAVDFMKQFAPKFSDETIKASNKRSGTDAMIFKIISPKMFAKKLAFFTQNKAKFKH
jgi:hypothetical protein